MAALDAGYDVRASGVTIDRFCGSGITSVNLAAATIMSGMADLAIAGGTEMMSYTAAIADPKAPPFIDAVTSACAPIIRKAIRASAPTPSRHSRRHPARSPRRARL
jgi:acetyl-CoA acetyltransferase